MTIEFLMNTAPPLLSALLLFNVTVEFPSNVMLQYWLICTAPPYLALLLLNVIVEYPLNVILE